MSCHHETRMEQLKDGDMLITCKKCGKQWRAAQFDGFTRLVNHAVEKFDWKSYINKIGGKS